MTNTKQITPKLNIGSERELKFTRLIDGYIRHPKYDSGWDIRFVITDTNTILNELDIKDDRRLSVIFPDQPWLDMDGDINELTKLVVDNFTRFVEPSDRIQDYSLNRIVSSPYGIEYLGVETETSDVYDDNLDMTIMSDTWVFDLISNNLQQSNQFYPTFKCYSRVTSESDEVTHKFIINDTDTNKLYPTLTDEQKTEFISLVKQEWDW